MVQWGQCVVELLHALLLAKVELEQTPVVVTVTVVEAICVTVCVVVSQTVLGGPVGQVGGAAPQLLVCRLMAKHFVWPKSGLT